MTHQTVEKHLNNMSEYFVGVVNIAVNHYKHRFMKLNTSVRSGGNLILSLGRLLAS